MVVGVVVGVMVRGRGGRGRGRERAEGVVLEGGGEVVELVGWS